MKNFITLFAGALLLAACAAPKYSYYFDHYDYNSGKKKAQPDQALTAVNTLPALTEETEASPLSLEDEAVVASAGNNAVVTEKDITPAASRVTGKKYTDLTKAEKKEFRKALKTEVKKYMKAKKSGDHGASIADTKALDYNLKMAIIFGAVALTLSFFGGVNSVFWILSVVSLVIGVVFFIKWIAEQ
jgi:hypothetical protein